MPAPTRLRRRRVTSVDVLAAALVCVLVGRFALAGVWAAPAVAAWVTVFAALCVQATPYLVLGVLVSAAVGAVPASLFRRVLPARPVLAVPVAALAGAALPGCECGSVPVAASLMRRGVRDAPAIAFLLAAPAVNPVVLVATAVAFPGRPVVVLARFVASLATAVVTGWLWLRLGRAPAVAAVDHGHGGWAHARDTAVCEFARSLGLLVVGAAAAATIDVAVPPRVLDTLGGAGVPTAALLAVAIAVCSEADAFVAASLVRFGVAAQLTFMVVGPAVDVKLIAMQVGTFGGRVAARLAPLTLAVAVGSSVLVAGVLL